MVPVLITLGIAAVFFVVLALAVATWTEFFKNIDRRWIFLLMLLAVGVPIYVLGLRALLSVGPAPRAT